MRIRRFEESLRWSLARYPGLIVREESIYPSPAWLEYSPSPLSFIFPKMLDDLPITNA